MDATAPLVRSTSTSGAEKSLTVSDTYSTLTCPHASQTMRRMPAMTELDVTGWAQDSCPALPAGSLVSISPTYGSLPIGCPPIRLRPLPPAHKGQSHNAPAD